MIRYILQPVLKAETDARIFYLTKALHCSFVQHKTSPDFIELIAYPPLAQSFLSVTGHNKWVANFFQQYRFDTTATVTVINSCSPGYVLDQLPWLENVYYCKTNLIGMARLRDGSAFGLGFEVTDSELDLLTAPGSDLLTRLYASYRKVA